MDPYGEGGVVNLSLPPCSRLKIEILIITPCYVVGNPLAVFKVGGGDFSSIAWIIYLSLSLPPMVYGLFLLHRMIRYEFLPVESSRSASIVGCENDHSVIKHSIPFKSFRYVSNGLVQWSYHPSIRPSVVHYNILEFLKNRVWNRIKCTSNHIGLGLKYETSWKYI